MSVKGELASHICVSVKMKGPLRIDILKKSLDIVINHHDIFRFRFDLDQENQMPTDSAGWSLHHEDISHEKRPWKKLDSLLLENGKIPFDLKNECPARFYIYNVVSETSVFALVCHHLALDGWSIAQFVEDVSRAYTSFEKNENFTLPKRLNYADFVKNPLRFGNNEKEREAKIFWENKFKSKSISHFPFPKDSSQTLDGSRFIFSIDYEEYNGVKDISKQNKVTPFIYLLSAFYKTLMERNYLPDFTIGIPAGNRNLEGADKMMGQCANLLTFKIAAQKEIGNEDLLKLIKQEMIDSFRYMIHPYEELEQFVGRPLFNITFNMEPTSDLPDFGEVSLFIHPFPITVSEFDLTINITDLEYHYHCEIDYRTDVLSEAGVLKLSQEFIKIIQKLNKSFKQA